MSVGFDDVLYDGKAKAGPADFFGACSAAVPAVKAFEYPAEIFFRDSEAIVFNDDVVGLVAGILDRHPHKSTRLVT